MLCVGAALSSGPWKEPDGPKLLMAGDYDIDLVRDETDGLCKIKKWILGSIWRQGDDSVMQRPETQNEERMRESRGVRKKRCRFEKCKGVLLILTLRCRAARVLCIRIQIQKFYVMYLGFESISTQCGTVQSNSPYTV
jgi:hypothetical protein